MVPVTLSSSLVFYLLILTPGLFSVPNKRDCPFTRYISQHSEVPGLTTYISEGRADAVFDMASHIVPTKNPKVASRPRIQRGL